MRIRTRTTTPPTRAPGRTPITRVRRRIRTLLATSGVPPEIIYAFETTGRIVTEQNRRSLTAAERREWDDAIREFRRTTRRA